MDYTAKHVLVTGGSSGIGLALARKLVAAGANTWILARDAARLQPACEELTALRVNASQQVGAITADVSDWSSISTLLESHIRDHGPFDLAINSAGVTRPGKFMEMDLSIFRSMMEINYFGTLHVLKSVLPSMIERGSGYVVNVSSMAGFLGVYGYSSYGPSKFAVRGLSDSLRYELAEHGVGISVVFPPDTDTPQLAYETPFKPPVLLELDRSNKVMTADAVADAILKGVAKRRYIITPGSDTSLYFGLTNFFGLVYPVMSMMVAQARRAAHRSQGNSAAKNHGSH